MKKINLLIASVVALLVFASCGAGSNDNVYTKKAAVYKAAIKKLNAATDAAALNEVNANLEKEIATINIECVSVYLSYTPLCRKKSRIYRNRTN